MKTQMPKIRTLMIISLCFLGLQIGDSKQENSLLAADKVDATLTRGQLRARWRLNRNIREKRTRNTQKTQEEKSNFSEKYKSLPANRRSYSLRMQRVSNDSLVNTVNMAIEITKKRSMTADRHTPWQILHGTLAMRQDFKINVNGRQMSAIQWLATQNPKVGNKYLIEKTPHGARTHKYTKPYDFEGHPNQFLGILTMSNLPIDYKFHIAGNQTITMADLVENAKKDINAEEEVAWTLWFLSHYLNPNEEWMSSDGEYWSIERLVEEELESDVYKSACGGTHGLFALAFARNNYIRKTKSKRLKGPWMKAQLKINRFIKEAQNVQRPNGSFPTKYFKGYGEPKNFTQRVTASGHMMEWLMVALPDERLNEPWVRKGIYYLATQVITYRNSSADCGPLYHALDALVIYRDRVLHKKSPSELYLKPRIMVTQKPSAKPISDPKKVTKKDNSKTPAALAVIQKKTTKPTETKMPQKPAPVASNSKPEKSRAENKAAMRDSKWKKRTDAKLARKNKRTQKKEKDLFELPEQIQTANQPNQKTTTK